MACIQYILVLVTVMSKNPWSYGVASQFTWYGHQNRQLNHSTYYYEPQQNHQRTLRSSNESSRMNERSILIQSATQDVQNEPKSSSRNQSASYKILNEYSKKITKENRRGQIQEPSFLDRVVFPGQTSTYSNKFIPEIPEECKKLGICESVPNYPDEHVSNILAEIGSRGAKFQIDELENDTPDIAQRLGPQEDNLELCSSREKVMFPEALPDSQNEWHWVVNPKDKRVQGFRVEICQNNQSSCADFITFQPGYEGHCVQKYVNRNMQVLDKGGKMVDMSLKVPSCCSCVAKVHIR